MKTYHFAFWLKRGGIPVDPRGQKEDAQPEKPPKKGKKTQIYRKTPKKTTGEN